MKKAIIILLSIIPGCFSSKNIVFTSYGEGLIGSVRMTIENRIAGDFDSDGFSIDTTASKILPRISNYFTEEGLLKSVELIYNDENLNQTRISFYDKKGKYEGGKGFNSTGDTILISRIIEASESKMRLQWINPKTRRVEQKVETWFENGHVIKMIAENPWDNSKFQYEYLRNMDGVDTCLITSIWLESWLGSDTTLYDFMEMDAKGNWIKRFEYRKIDPFSGILIEREIQYY